MHYAKSILQMHCSNERVKCIVQKSTMQMDCSNEQIKCIGNKNALYNDIEQLDNVLVMTRKH